MSQWQASYNEIESHLRREEIMKAELHHRVEVTRTYKDNNVDMYSVHLYVHVHV